jgi:hypothetical protein
MFPQASARTRSVYGTTCWRRESCAYLQQIPFQRPYTWAERNGADYGKHRTFYGREINDPKSTHFLGEIFVGAAVGDKSCSEAFSDKSVQINSRVGQDV